MRLIRYDKFELIPGYENIINSIPVFSTQVYADYLNVTKKSKTSWFVALNEQDIYYMIPLSIMKKGTIKKGTFLTSTISFGGDNSLELERKFLNDIINYIKVNKLCDWIEQGPNWAIFNVYPDGAKYAEFGTYKINLEDKTEEELYQNLNRRVRKRINKLKRDNKIKIKKGEDCFNDAVGLINNTLSEANLTPFTKIKFELIYKYLKDNLVVYTTYYEDVPQSSIVYFYNLYSLYCVYSGTKKNAIQGATDILKWEIIKDSKNKNVKYFDFVGALIKPVKDSKPYRIQRNKSHFGPELIEGYVWKMIINKNIYTFYIYYMRIKNMLKGEKIKIDFIDRQAKKRKD